MKVYLGDVGTTQEEKDLMPMTGGFFREETFKIEERTRTASGKLVMDVKAVKKRVVVSFQKMLVADYETWVAEQRLKEWREIEYEENDGSFTKLVVDFLGNYGHQRLKTMHEWVYGQIDFTFEEV